MKTYDQFRRDIRLRESSDRYDCVNRFGYLGAYQFGMPRLCDLGMARKLPGDRTPGTRYEFVPPLTRDQFLSDTTLQDACFDRHVQDLRARLSHWYRDENLSGAIAACHLLGYQSFIDYFRSGKDRRDGLGTSISEYYQAFSGYEIPESSS